MSGSEYTLEFLLSFDGRLHWYSDGYFAKFEIRRTRPSPEHAHGLRYSLTLHDPGGTRLIGFDNAHPAVAARSRYGKKPVVADHWHRTEHDPGRPYDFKDAATLIEDFFDEVERALAGRGITVRVIGTEDERSRT